MCQNQALTEAVLLIFWIFVCRNDYNRRSQFHTLDRQMDMTMILVAAVPHTRKLYSLMLRSIRRDIAHEEDESFEHAFSVTTSFSTADIAPGTINPSERVEIYDSGASCHMSPYIEAFTDFTFIEPKPISAADNRTFEAVGKGSIQIKIPNDNGFTLITLRDVLYAPTIGFTLISLSRADKAGYSTLIRDSDLHILDRKNDDSVIGRIPARKGL